MMLGEQPALIPNGLRMVASGWEIEVTPDGVGVLTHGELSVMRLADPFAAGSLTVDNVTVRVHPSLRPSEVGPATVSWWWVTALWAAMMPTVMGRLASGDVEDERP